MTKDEARDEVHQRVDKLAERIGTDPTVTIDGPVGVDSHKPTVEYYYNVDVDIESGVLDKVRGPIAEDMRDHGWTVDEHLKSNGVSFLHEDGRTFGVTISDKYGTANVRGDTPFTNPDQ